MRYSWTVIPSLTLVGFVSGVFTLFFIWPPTSLWIPGGAEHGFLYTLLGSSGFALCIASVLVFRREMQPWAAPAAIAVTIGVHFVEFYAQPALTKGLNALSDSATNPVVFRECFVVALPVIAAFLLATSQRRPAWIVLIAPPCAAMAALMAAYFDKIQQGGLINLLTGDPLLLTWQVNLAFFLGLAVWLQVLLPRSSAEARSARVDLPPGSRGLALAIPAVFFVAVGFWYLSAEKKYAAGIQDEQQRVKAGIARSISEAPSATNLPQVQAKPIDQVLLMDGVGDWKPYMSGSSPQPGQAGATSSWVPCPCQLMTYYARYAEPGNDWAVVAHVTEYPDSDWAKYEVRNTPMPNESIEGSVRVASISRFGNRLYRDGAYYYWSSGNRLIFLDCEGILPSVIDEFLRAYLEKYPSSL